ncbi:MAG: resolvase [Synechococcales bacterium]|nr:resolvase [Synechococcales bacterium]
MTFPLDDPSLLPLAPPAAANGESTAAFDLMSVEVVQKALRRSRASVYRYANTDPELVNPPFDAGRLNPEYRRHKDEPLQFHPNEVERFARDILGQHVTVAVQKSEQVSQQELLKQILMELRAIRQLLEAEEL